MGVELENWQNAVWSWLLAGAVYWAVKSLKWAVKSLKR
jgi:hypothetical protein